MNSLSSSRITAIVEGPNQHLWIATFQGGLNRFDPFTETFYNYMQGKNTNVNFSGEDVNAMVMDSSGCLWLGYRNQGLDRFNPATGELVNYHHEPNQPSSIISNGVSSLLTDRSGNLWIGTWDMGLCKLKKELHDIKSNFRINNELLSHVQSEMQFEGKSFPSHIYLNEKAELDQRQQLIKDLIEIEDETIKNKHFPNLKEATKFKTNNIIKKYHELFKWNRTTGMLERNVLKIKEKISSLGYFILLTNRKELDKSEILEKYRNRDSVEKVFDLLKNENDGNRLRAHSQYNSDARLFIKFISLIIQ